MWKLKEKKYVKMINNPYRKCCEEECCNYVEWKPKILRCYCCYYKYTAPKREVHFRN
jgi:hypothetical protein